MKPRPGALDAAALALSLPLAAVFYLPRLPADLGGLLSREPGPLVQFLVAAGARPPLRVIVLGLVYLSLLAGAALLLRAAWSGLKARKGRPSAAGAAALLAWLAAVVSAARLGLACSLDLLQNVFYAPESLSAAEPALTWLAFAWFCLCALRAGAAGWSREGRAWGAALLVPAAALWILGRAAFDAGQPSLETAARLAPPPSGIRALAVLKTEDGRPKADEFTLKLGEPGETDYGEQRLDAAEVYARRGRSVYRRAALRFLYGGRAIEQDAEGLRRALLLGLELGDPLAAGLLLEHLACLADSPSARELLAAASDESVRRVGFRAAEKLARAHARLGASVEAARLRARAVSAPGAPPEGLLGGLPYSDAPYTAPRGSISGVFSGARGRVGLYCRPAEWSPYALGPAQLSASVPLDAAGRFKVGGLPEGSYFLAARRDAPTRENAVFRVEGHRGDLAVTKARPAVRVELRAR